MFFFMQVAIPPSYFNYRFCYCIPGYYGLPPDRCKPCLEGGDCSYGHGGIRWPRGYYPIFNSSTSTSFLLLEIAPCLFLLCDWMDAADLIALVTCHRGLESPETSACNPNANCSIDVGANMFDTCELCAHGTSGSCPFAPF